MSADPWRPLTGRDLARIRRDPEFAADVLDGLAFSLGYAIAIMTKGDPVAASKLVDGACNRVVEEAADAAPIGQLMAMSGRRGGAA